jgi:hypothetical protein
VVASPIENKKSRQLLLLRPVCAPTQALHCITIPTYSVEGMNQQQNHHHQNHESMVNGNDNNSGAVSAQNGSVFSMNLDATEQAAMYRVAAAQQQQQQHQLQGAGSSGSNNNYLSDLVAQQTNNSGGGGGGTDPQQQQPFLMQDQGLNISNEIKRLQQISLVLGISRSS